METLSLLAQLFLLIFVVLQTEPRALSMLGKHSVTGASQFPFKVML